MTDDLQARRDKLADQDRRLARAAVRALTRSLEITDGIIREHESRVAHLAGEDAADTQADVTIRRVERTGLHDSDHRDLPGAA